MNHYKCIQVGHHKDVGPVIEEEQKEGWRLHTYQPAVANSSMLAPVVYHYLLFEKESKE